MQELRRLERQQKGPSTLERVRLFADKYVQVENQFNTALATLLKPEYSIQKDFRIQNQRLMMSL